MSDRSLHWPRSTAASLLAAFTTWVSLWAWSGFVEQPSGFLVPVLGGCLLIAAVGALLRAVPLPAAVVLVGQLTAVTLWLTHRWAADVAWWGWLPNPAAVEETRRVMSEAAVAAQSYAAPLPQTAPEIFPMLVACGVGAAILVDFLAVGLRRVPVAGLPLLAVYTAPLSIVEGGVPWWGFVAVAVMFLLLLANDEGRRLSAWGRQLSRDSAFDTADTDVDAATLRASARKIGLTATGLAVVAPFLVPTLQLGLFDGSGPGGSGDGDAVAISNPIVDLRRDLVRGEDIDLVRVTTQDRNPSYLRLTVLDTFDGETWKPSGREIPVEQRAEGALPQPPGLGPGVPTTEYDYRVLVSPEFQSRWLPTTYPVSLISARGDWRYDLETFDFISAIKGQDTAGLGYRFRGIEVEPTAEALAASGPAPEGVFSRYTELPEGLPDIVPRLAREVTAGAASRFERAVRLQRWFRDDGGFSYSLDRRSGNATDDLVEFLSTGPSGRIGYCEQFSASMALMARTLGIPARVAVGFLSPQQVSENDFVFSAHDLHAWPELYFDGVGWIRFEPTPQDRATGVPGYTSVDLPGLVPSEAPETSFPTRGPDDIVRPTPGVEDGASAGGSGDGSAGAGVLAGLVVLLTLALVGAAPRALRAWVRQRRFALAATPTTVAEAAWSELRDTALDLRLPWDDTVTVRTRARALVQSFGEPDWSEDDRYERSQVRGPEANPEATRALERIVVLVERARFARRVEDLETAGTVQQDVLLCEKALRDGARRRQRRLATWLPASLVRGRRDHSAGGSDHLTDSGVDRTISV